MRITLKENGLKWGISSMIGSMVFGGLLAFEVQRNNEIGTAMMSMLLIAWIGYFVIDCVRIERTK